MRFAGFAERWVAVGDGGVYIRRRGEGPPVLLLHGFPETHLMWHDVAPSLAEHHTVVVADLPGYGASRTNTTNGPSPSSKRAMAADLTAMMRTEGLERFGVAGHDRGGRVAYRMALDHPDQVERLAVLDIVATSDAFDRTLVLWSEGGSLDTWYADEGGPLALWAAWSRSVTGHPVAGGHFFPEQNPTTTAAELLSFFSAPG